MFARCKACHEIASSEGVVVRGGRTGPNLYGVVGRRAGASDLSGYGESLAEAGERGLVWTEAAIAGYVKDPSGFLQTCLGDPDARSRMAVGLPRGGKDVAAFLASHAD